MTYNTIAAMAGDPHLRLRLTACAAQEHKPGPSYEAWVSERIWDIVTAPGWGDDWAYAVANNVADIGRSESVITDGAILAVIQNMD